MKGYIYHAAFTAQWFKKYGIFEPFMIKTKWLKKPKKVFGKINE